MDHEQDYISGMTPADIWKQALQNWAIPAEILAQAPIPPWSHPVDLFEVSSEQVGVRNPSDEIALAGLGEQKSILDIGAGGGRASFALVPHINHAIAVDHQAEMLAAFARKADELGVEHAEVLGDWPAVAVDTPTAEVVLCHHVFYNVQSLIPFIEALTAKATRRVVVELPEKHPMSDTADAWQHFWGIERPTEPSAELAYEVVKAAGLNPQIKRFSEAPRSVAKPERAIELFRIRLCLTADRDAEIAEFLANREKPTNRELATIWWDV